MMRLFNIFSIIFILFPSLLFSSVAKAEGWQIRQVEINHIQAGNAERIYITVNANVKELSGCTTAWDENWATIPLANMTEVKKHLINFATVAQTSKQKVDVGGTVGDCSGDLPVITFIRVGDHTKA